MPPLKLSLKIIAYPTIAILIILALIYLFITVMNSDLYGRLVQTEQVTDTGDIESPLVYLTIHRILLEENCIEVSVTLEVGDSLFREVKNGKVSVLATVRDASSIQSYNITQSIVIDSSKSLSGKAIQSERFLLPVLPSLSVYPYDELEIRPQITTYVNSNFIFNNLFIQNYTAGRLLNTSFSPGNSLVVGLSRLAAEKALIIVSSILFIFLSLVISVGFFKLKKGLTNLEELLAIAGFIIATAGFREILGISRISGTSALEIAVIGIPLLGLFVGMSVSYIRGFRNLNP